MFYFDTTYLWFMLPCIILSLICQVRVKSAFSKYGKVPNSRRLTGAQAAEYVLRQNGVTGVRIEHVAGNLTDHYDPRTNVIRLSDSVYNATSVAAVGVAAHEAGHAVQTARGYLPGRIRTAIVPAVNLTQQWWGTLFFMGFLLNMGGLVQLAVILFAFSVVFHLVTLPVEIDASRRAVAYLSQYGSEVDQRGAKAVLTAAAMTYVASALSSILQLLYLLSRTSRRSSR